MNKCNNDLHNNTDTRKDPKTETLSINPEENSKTEKSDRNRDRVSNNITSNREIGYRVTAKMFLQLTRGTRNTYISCKTKKETAPVILLGIQHHQTKTNIKSEEISTALEVESAMVPVKSILHQQNQSLRRQQV